MEFDIGTWLAFYGGTHLGITALSGIRKRRNRRSKPIGLIHLDGTIQSNNSQNKGITPDFVKHNVKLAKAEGRRGLIFEVSSPGGLVSPSAEIGDYIKGLDIPTVTYVSNMAASGGYWIASATDRIIISRMAQVGSIGVIMPRVDFSELAERLGIAYDPIHTGEHKASGHPLSKLEGEEREVLERRIKKIHEQFVTEIAGNRSIDRDLVIRLATGEMYSAEEAIGHSLIDAIGYKLQAVNELADLMGVRQGLLTEDSIKVYGSRPKGTRITSLLSSASENMAYGIGERIADGFRERITRL